MSITGKLQDLPEPWERQLGEGAKPFEAFKIYRDMGVGKRGIRKVVQELNKSHTLIARWSTEHAWVERVNQYDAHLDKLQLEKEEKERKEMSELHIKTARSMLSKALTGLQAIPANEMKAADITKMIEVATKLERLSRGESTESVETFGKAGAIPAVQIYLPSNGKEAKE